MTAIKSFLIAVSFPVLELSHICKACQLFVCCSSGKTGTCVIRKLFTCVL